MPHREDVTRIVVMSDTHMLHDKLTVPDGDIVVHCGDWAGEDRLDEYEAFFAWFSSLPHAQCSTWIDIAEIDLVQSCHPKRCCADDTGTFHATRIHAMIRDP